MNKATLNTFVANCAPFLYNWYKTYKHRQRRISNGSKFPEQTFYLIGYDDPNGGLFWLMNKALMHIAYAEEKGWISIIDLQSYITQYTRPEMKGKTNIWEMFFKQPYGYTLADVSEAKNIVINKLEPSPTPKYLMGQDAFYNNAERIRFFRDLYQKHIHFNENTEKYLLDIKNKVFGNRKNIIGVLCRGTDYTSLKPKGHPIQPTPQMVIEDTKEAMKHYNCDTVFLATEDQDILNIFQSHFGSHLLYIEQERFCQKNISKGELLAETRRRTIPNFDPYTAALQYLSAIWLLTQCDCFIGGRTGGTKGVLIMSQGFKYQYIYNLGIY